MANAAAATNSWNSLNYTGELYLIGAQAKNKPFLSMIGGVNGSFSYGDVRFPIAQTYALETAAQPAITETASLTAPTPTTYVRGQDFNTAQIFQEQVSVSYMSSAQPQRLGAAGLAQIGDQPVNNELAFQQETTLLQIYNDMNYTFLNGTYQLATGVGVASKTRGIITAVSTGAIAAGTVDLSKDLMDEMFRTMAAGGAIFSQPVIFCSALDVQRLNDIYGFQPQDVSVGGTNVETIIAPFVGRVSVIWDVNVPAGTLLCADLSVCKPVFTDVVGKPTGLFYEELAKTGAAESGQFFGSAGIDYGPEEYHGKITGLTTS